MGRLSSYEAPFRNPCTIVLLLCTDVIIEFQINFFEDHTKIILCPLMGAVTYIDEKRNFKTYRLASLEKVNIKLEYAVYQCSQNFCKLQVDTHQLHHQKKKTNAYKISHKGLVAS